MRFFVQVAPSVAGALLCLCSSAFAQSSPPLRGSLSDAASTPQTSPTSNTSKPPVAAPGRSDTTPAWLFTPYVSLTETLTDNVRNSPTNHESDLISVVSAGLRVTADTPRLQMDGHVSGGYSKYARATDQDRFTSTGFLRGTATIVPDFVFADFTGLSEVFQRTEGAFTGPAALNKDNSVQTYVATASPYAKWEVGDVGSFELRYAANYSWFVGKTAAISPTIGPITNQNQQEAKAEFAMPGTLAPRLFSDAYVDGQYTDAAKTIGILHRYSGAEINEYQLTRAFSVIAAGGYEQFVSHLFPKANGQGATWSGGVRWRPNDESSILVTYGRHDLADDFAGEVQFKITPFTVLYGAYTDSISTTQGQLTGGATSGSIIQNGSLVSQVNGDQPIAGVTFDQNPVIATVNKAFVANVNALNGQLTPDGEAPVQTGVPVFDLNSYYPIQNSLFRQKSLRAILFRQYYDTSFSLEAYHNSRTPLTTLLPSHQQADGGLLIVTKSLSEYLIGYVHGGYQNLSTSTPGVVVPGGSEGWNAGVGMSYALFANGSLYARYTFNRVKPAVASPATQQNAVSVGLTLHF